MLPEFKERDAAHVAAKAKRLEPVIEAAHGPQGARRARRCPRATRFPAMPRKMVDASGNEQAKEWLEQVRRVLRHRRRTSAFDQITQ